MTSLMLVLGAAASSLILVFLVIWSGPLVLYLVLSEPKKLPSIRKVALFLGLSIVLLLPIILPLIREALQGGNTSFLFDSSQSIPSDIFAPVVPPWYTWMRKSIYIGIVPAYLCIVALGRKRRSAALWILLMLGAYLFSIGPNPVFLGRELPLELPWSRAIAPLIRQTHRLNTLVSFGLAATVAYGWCAFAEVVSKKGRASMFASVAVAILLVDFLALPLPMTSAHIPQFYARCLAAREEELNLAIIPSGRQIDKLHMYYQTVHGMKMTGGTVSRHTEEEYVYLQANPLLRAGRMENWPADPPSDSLGYLKDLADNGIDLLILEKTLLDVGEWRAAIPISPSFEDSFVVVYDVGRLTGTEWLDGDLCPRLAS
jgi:hypothetical protein